MTKIYDIIDEQLDSSSLVRKIRRIVETCIAMDSSLTVSSFMVKMQRYQAERLCFNSYGGSSTDDAVIAECLFKGIPVDWDSDEPAGLYAVDDDQLDMEKWLTK